MTPEKEQKEGKAVDLARADDNGFTVHLVSGRSFSTHFSERTTEDINAAHRDAVREAERKAFERAAKVAEALVPNGSTMISCPKGDGSKWIAAEIRKLGEESK